MIRERTDSDVATCIDILTKTRLTGQYPVHWPANPTKWLSRHELHASVYVNNGTLVGHVAVHNAEDDPAAVLWTASTGRDEHGLGVISRLFVAPALQRQGIGEALLVHAINWARSHGLTPVMDVAIEHDDAIAYYERRGWMRLGETQIPRGADEPLRVVAMSLTS